MTVEDKIKERKQTHGITVNTDNWIDGFKSGVEFNNQQLCEIKLSSDEIRRIEFAKNELIRIGKHTGNETFFKDLKSTIEKLKLML